MSSTSNSTSAMAVFYVFLSTCALAAAVVELVIGNTAQTFACVAIALALTTLSRVEHVLHLLRRISQERDPS